MNTRVSWSLLALIAGNLVPLLGVLFLEWDIAFILGLFWVENLVVGGFNILKIVAACIVQAKFRHLFYAVFFLLHYGLFCAVHGTFLWDLLDLGALPEAAHFAFSNWLVLNIANDGLDVFMGFSDRFGAAFQWAVLALILSHSVRFFDSFISNGDLLRQSASNLMGQPYRQIMIMHAGLIMGAIVIDEFGSHFLLLALVVVLKLFTDGWQHNKQSSKSTSASRSDTATGKID